MKHPQWLRVGESTHVPIKRIRTEKGNDGGEARSAVGAFIAPSFARVCCEGIANVDRGGNDSELAACRLWQRIVSQILTAHPLRQELLPDLDLETSKGVVGRAAVPVPNLHSKDGSRSTAESITRRKRWNRWGRSTGCYAAAMARLQNRTCTGGLSIQAPMKWLSPSDG